MMRGKRGPARLTFTPEMDAALLHLRGRLTTEAVAERVGVSPAIMYRRLKELGAPIRPHTRRAKA